MSWKEVTLALAAFAAWARREHGLDVRIVDHPLAGIDRLQPAPPLVVVSGLDDAAFTRAEVEAIGDFTGTDTILTFTMPASDVTVTAHFSSLLPTPREYKEDALAIVQLLRQYFV